MIKSNHIIYIYIYILSLSQELSRLWNTFYPHVLQLISLSKKRASDLIDLEDRRKIESANYVLKNNTPLLHTSCKVSSIYDINNVFLKLE